MRNKYLPFLVILLIFLLSSSAKVVAEFTSPRIPILVGTVPPLATPVGTSVPTVNPFSEIELAKYILNTTIDYDAHALTVFEDIYYPNNSADPLDRLVLAVVPNLWAGSFNLTSLSIDDIPLTTFSINGQRLEITLPAALQPSAIVKINIEYILNLPFAEQEDPNISRPRIFGYTTRQMNLTNWYPFVVPYINGEWVLHEPWVYGEHLVYDAADYEVNLNFTDPASAPIIAASGFPEQIDNYTRYTINSARTFALSASREFQVSTLKSGDVTISSYYFSPSEAAGQAALQTSAESIEVYGERFGPYPHKSLAVVMGDFNDGMEFSGFFYLSRDFYSLYDGTPTNYLTFVAAHETAHQWWFDQVANDQALQPWVDETLSTYSEYIYYESIYPDLTSWWWRYRIDFYKPQGLVDISIYEGNGFRPYTNAAYFRGARFMEELRRRMGDEAFFAFLQDYFTKGRGRIVTANDFFRVLGQHTSTDYSDLVKKYFKNTY
ncbi:M1 family metallopeptidase [Candidatus Villigracilis saccharophilus]|uniref:M1 family metallopeptidase n=1 Tax=Candidatus Villigracilis saccharophilus TaxID=3140684 RepID=UPI00313661C5|nr:M1 family metallopeptidase [Anaerolineales bacterium]